jgi:tRNA pseudouridine65 synthase
MRLLHADARVAVFDKPSGLLVHRGWGDADVTAVELARAAVGDVFPVHRLDRATSGVLAFARDAATARELHGAFEQHLVDKRYVALVRGAPPASGVVDHPIPRREGGPRVDAKTSFTTLELLEVDWTADVDRDPRLPSRGAYAVVEARPETGRLHQVRRHMKHAGHPVIGDANYGRGEHNRAIARRFGLARLALHARALGFTIGGVRYAFTAALPEDFAGPLARMGASTWLCEELARAVA